MDRLNTERKFNMDMEYREEVLSKISKVIESKIGRTKPTICDISNFEKNKEVIEGDIKRKKHFNEKDWPNCVDIFFNSLKTLRQPELDNVSSEDDNDYNDIRDAR